MERSKLVSYVNISPNKNSGRLYNISRITPHCSVCDVGVKRLVDIFKPTSKKASCNYAIGNEGKIGLCVEECDRSWCSSSKDNDNRAITIEVSSSNKHPYTISNEALDSLINLMTDICKRYNKTKLIWINDKNRALKYNVGEHEMLITLHKWFKNKDCPGKYIIDHLDYIVNSVNNNLDVDYIEYVIKKGDTLYSISRKYGVSIYEIASDNNIDNVDLIIAGRKLKIRRK